MAVERWTDEMLDKLAESLRETRATVDELVLSGKEFQEEMKVFQEEMKVFREDMKVFREEGREMRENFKELNIRFSAYQQASQWVVNLAFGLLATATITTIVSAVVRR